MSRTPLHDALIKKVQVEPLAFDHGEIWSALACSERSYATLRDTIAEVETRLEEAHKRFEKLTLESKLREEALKGQNEVLRAQVLDLSDALAKGV